MMALVGACLAARKGKDATTFRLMFEFGNSGVASRAETAILMMTHPSRPKMSDESRST